MSDRRSVNVNSFPADGLLDLPDSDFRALVDADLRRNAQRNGVAVRAELVDALRSPEVAPRWYSVLCQMQASVDGQLRARESDFEAEHARLAGEVEEIVQRMEFELPITDGEGVALSRTEAQERLVDLKGRLYRLRADYERTRAATLRFKTGLDEATASASYRQDRAAGGLFRTTAALERDWWARRCADLEAAIVVHRDAVVSDLAGDAPDEIDTALWGVVSATEPSVVRGKDYEADAGRDGGARRSGSSDERRELVGSAEARR